MNIKEHIEAGHYPKDEKGRPLVPTRDGDTVIVCATDRPGACPIVGYAMGGSDNGFAYYADSSRLLPPPPRKVKVTGWSVVQKGGGLAACNHDTREEAERSLRNNYVTTGIGVVELTGEYEEPWA